MKKVIQFQVIHDTGLVVLCEDGTIWKTYDDGKGWCQITLHKMPIGKPPVNGESWEVQEYFNEMQLLTDSHKVIKTFAERVRVNATRSSIGAYNTVCVALAGALYEINDEEARHDND